MSDWPGNISDSVETLLPAVPAAYGQKGAQQFYRDGVIWGSLQVLGFFWHALEHLKATLRCFPGLQWALPAVHFSMANSQGPCAVSHELKGIHEEVVLVSPAPFLQPLRVARTAYRRISASRSEVLLQKWLRSLLNKLAGKVDREVWCIKSYRMDHPWKEITQLQLWCLRSPQTSTNTPQVTRNSLEWMKAAPLNPAIHCTANCHRTEPQSAPWGPIMYHQPPPPGISVWVA